VALLDEIRAACARVVQRARHVRIDTGGLAALADALPGPDGVPGLAPGVHLVGGDPERLAAFHLQLDAINFGSGWFPTLRKRPGLSGYRTVAAGLKAHGPWSAEALAALEPRELAAALGQDPEHELVALWARHLRWLGETVEREHGGAFLAAARSGDGSAERLVERIARWPGWRDEWEHHGLRVPLYKRAQIAASDLHLAGVARFGDLPRLTLFADNLVPHVLRHEGVLRLDPALAARIDAGELLQAGSAEEVELRAVALHAGELIVARRPDLTPREVDMVLWTRGGEPRFKAHPRPRARSTAY
jgi:hypothetical protein